MEMTARRSVVEDEEALLGADAATDEPGTPRGATRRRAGWWPRCAGAVVAFGLAAYAAGSRNWIVADETVSFKNDGEAHELRLRVGLDAVSYAHVMSTPFLSSRSSASRSDSPGFRFGRTMRRFSSSVRFGGS